MDSDGLDLESLFVYIKEYPVLYDKKHKDFHRKDIKWNAWREVATKLNVDNI